MFVKISTIFGIVFFYCLSSFSWIPVADDSPLANTKFRGLASMETTPISASIEDEDAEELPAADRPQISVRYSAQAWGQYPETVIPEGFYDVPGEERLPSNGDDDLSLDDIYGTGDKIPAYEEYGADDEFAAAEVSGQIDFADDL